MANAAFRSLLCAIAWAVAVGPLAGCTYYQVVPAAPAPGPRVFDRSWNAALGALEDTGVAVTLADRSSGTIYGAIGSDSVTIRVLTQADASVRVEFGVHGPRMPPWRNVSPPPTTVAWAADEAGRSSDAITQLALLRP